jgi:hypothetical protein
MTRLLDWEARLASYLDSVRGKAYGFGAHDCILHGANSVKAQTGKDYARGYRRKYKSLTSGLRLIRAKGFADIPALVTAKLGEPVPPSLAHRGDLVLSDGSTGVCMGEFAYFVGLPGGLVRVPRKDWQMAWRV